MVSAVKCLRRVIAAVLLLVWLPANSLCLVERAGWLANDDCCPSSASKSAPGKPFDHSTCCTLPLESFKADKYSHLDIVPPFFISVLIFEALDDREAVRNPQRADFDPPPLAKTWQFSCRTALLPRAPSFAS